MELSDPEKRQRLIRLLKSAILLLIAALVCAVAFGAAYVFGIDITSRLDPARIFGAAQTTLVYDRKGFEVAGVHGLENRIWISVDKVPNEVKMAFVAAEDVRFYSHNGVDVKRILGALWSDIKAGQLVEGASTITQQLIKNSFLSGRKVFSRKIEEALMALELERRYTKDQILEMYLNFVYFGANAYGIEAAAKTYFGKSASALTLDEGALLAGLLKSTTHYAPHTNPTESVQRRNTVLSLMANYGFISSETAETAKQTKLSLADTPREDAFGYYVDAAVEEAAGILCLTYEEVVKGGYRIRTGLDSRLQAIAEQAFADNALFPVNAADGTKAQAAFVCIDPKTGTVSALIGGRSYEVKRGLNRALNGRRQPGSAIKPILVYAPALKDRALSPAAVLVDKPKRFGTYTPKNSEDKYRGPVTLREALTQSLNIPAVEILNTVGLGNAKAFAVSLGIPFDAKDSGLSLALGGFEKGVTPMELCAAYGALASLGEYKKPALVTSIEDKAGNVLFQALPKSERVLGEDASFILCDMLCDAVKSGTGKAAYLKNAPLAGKTGTNGFGEKGNRDIWMAAFNPDLCAVVWMGFDKTDDAHCLDGNVTGGTYTARFIKHVFDTYYENKKGPEYTVPYGVQKVRLERAPLFAGVRKPAADYLLDKDVVAEYLFLDEIAGLTRDANAPQCLVYGFAVRRGERGLPVVSFFVSSAIARYEVRRVCAGETEQVIQSLQGGDSFVFTDESAKDKTGYTYSIRPVDEGGKPLGNGSERIYFYVTKR
jgi:1A family penicillin-binding protein